MKHSTQRFRGRAAAGLAAAALGAFAILGGALPASAVGPNIDPDEPLSLTIHKHVQPETAGDPNDGTELADPPAAPLEGVTFLAQRVTSIDLTTNAGWATAADLAEQPMSAAVADVTANHVLDAGTSQATLADGTATFANLARGVYLVTETDPGTNPIAVPSQPFLVSVPLPNANEWVYGVHVYPKNSLVDIEKIVDDSAATGLGSTVGWTIENVVPFASEGNTLNSYIIGDQLDDRLAFVGATVTLAGTELTDGVEYDLAETDGLVTVTFTNTGLALLNAQGGDTIAVALETTVAAIGDGTIENTAQVFINDPTMQDGHESNEITSYWGAVSIVKHAADDTTALLDGAVFEVRATADGPAIEVGGETQFTTVDGTVTIPGLRTQVGGQEYFLVEVVAPTGYQLDPTPHAVTVQPGSIEQAVISTISNTQEPPFTLPVTGGDGATAFMIGGGALMLIALGVVLVQSRRRTAAAQD